MSCHPASPILPIILCATHPCPFPFPVFMLLLLQHLPTPHFRCSRCYGKHPRCLCKSSSWPRPNLPHHRMNCALYSTNIYMCNTNTYLYTNMYMYIYVYVGAFTIDFHFCAFYNKLCCILFALSLTAVASRLWVWVLFLLHSPTRPTRFVAYFFGRCPLHF